MKKKIKIILILLLSFPITCFANNATDYIDPEPYQSEYNNEIKTLKSSNFMVVTANDIATKIGYEILEKGGTAADAAVSIQLALGLVEPQSSGIGGGSFLTYYDKKSKKIWSYEGREKAPKELPEDIFLKNESPINFFSAAIGGRSVGVPSTLKAIHELHKDYGIFKWNDLVNIVKELSEKGFKPPNRLKGALKKEKYLFDIDPNSLFNQIKNNPEKKFINYKYTKTLKTIQNDISEFYSGKIARDIVSKVKNSSNSGFLSLEDLRKVEITKKKALCKKTQNEYYICGPNLPSSGTICVIQALLIFENLLNNKKIDSNNLELKLSILDFIYYMRSKNLADEDFENVDLEKQFEVNYLVKEFQSYQVEKQKKKVKNFHEIINSTSHFTIIDKYKNVLSATSSIESSFGSRLFTNGFFLNNQLTDFSFRIKDKNDKLIKNRPYPEKRPLSSMSPLIVFDKNKNFFMTIGSPGGKAIISYVFRILSDVLFLNDDLEKSFKKPNFIRIKGNTYLENEEQKKKLFNQGTVRKLTSGLASIKVERKIIHGFADHRRDGSVRGN